MATIRFGQLGRLKKDKIEEYSRLHEAVWPEVLETITQCNLKNYSIFLHGDLVFAYFEYVGSDFDADMAKMDADPVTQKWWTHTHPCFEEFAVCPDSRFYHDMKPIFYHE